MLGYQKERVRPALCYYITFSSTPPDRDSAEDATFPEYSSQKSCQSPQGYDSRFRSLYDNLFEATHGDFRSYIE